VLVFCRGRHTYNPQGLLRGNFKNSRPNKQATKTEDAYGQESEHGESEWGNYPTTIIKAKNRDTTNSHPTEKPVNLMTYLVETYTNPGDTVLDCYAGSGTTAIACIRTGRKFVGIEKDVKHFETACERVANELAQGVLLPPNH
jgi:site-specific DNA-methyltransferase (adenine-specific)